MSSDNKTISDTVYVLKHLKSDYESVKRNSSDLRYTTEKLMEYVEITADELSEVHDKFKAVAEKMCKKIAFKKAMRGI